MIRRLRDLWRSERGSVIILAAAGLPMIFVAALGSLDYLQVMRAKSEMQTAADSAAISAANEFYLVGGNDDRVKAVAQAVARSVLDLPDDSGVKIDTNVLPDEDGIRVEIKKTVQQAMLASFGVFDGEVTASATARPVGGGSLCIIGLMHEANVIYLRDNASINAPNCLVHSNSVRNKGIVTENSASITADLICSTGGVSGNPSSFNPTPLLDCPRMEDPLATRPEPARGGCLGKRLHIVNNLAQAPTNRRRAVTEMTGTLTRAQVERAVRIVGGGNNVIVTDGHPLTIYPGRYCNGLSITGNVDVTFAPGVYYFTGDLTVDDGASIKGEHVGLFFSGPSHRLFFGENTSIKLGAPKDGDMAGILIWVSDDGGVRRKHIIASNNASELLGTIYIPQGQLEIASRATVAQDSAYTAIVAEKLFLVNSPTLVLNTNYEATDVPVPRGLGPMNGAVTLSE